MTASEIALKRMLSGELPLDRVGPHLRHACRRALRSGDVDRMKLAAKVVIGELARRGELFAVSVDGGPDASTGQGPYCLVKGSERLLDLSFLGSAALTLPFPSNIQPPESKEPVMAGAEQQQAGQDLYAFTGILGALERAQDLEIGDPRAGEKAVILGSVLRLLENFMPGFPMFIMLHGSDSIPEEQDRLFTAVPDEAATAWLTVRTPGHSVWIPNLEELPGYVKKKFFEMNKSAPDHQDGAGSRAVAVPLWEPAGSGEQSSSTLESGLLFLVTGEGLDRDPMLRLAERLSRFVTRRWRHQREVNLRIHVDGLTGVYNRAFFDSQLTLELERARRSEVPLTLVIADLDKFKNVNDNYGHQVGDAALCMVARRLQEELRRIDHICRIGGEEFALILPDTSQEAAKEVMGRLLDSQFRTSASVDGETIDLAVTISFGVVTFPDAGADPFELYRKADAMLFLSKDLGRHRCHFWSSDGNHLQLLPPDTGD